MSNVNRPSLRIDWFDGTVIEDVGSRSIPTEFADEDSTVAPEPTPEVRPIEKKPIGFKRLLDISELQTPTLTIEVSHRTGFWYLLDVDLKGDFIVLIVTILEKIYATLEPGEKSKIATMLKSKFEKSKFVQTLKNYIISLPSVKIVEKSKNFHLWNDVELFFKNVVNLCHGIVHFGGHSKVFLAEIKQLLDEIETSAIGVCEEHLETIGEDVFIKINEMRDKLSNSYYKDKSLTSTSTAEIEAASSLKNFNIFPTKEDLLRLKKTDIQPNIINGAYQNSAHYLDLQFKLLREDCFGPLREGICKYVENPSKIRHDNIRVYPKVRIIRSYVTQNKVGHLVDIAWKERTNHSSVDSKAYMYKKQLMFGSLLLFTSDDFETVLCATVLDSSVNLLSEGYVAVAFQCAVSKRIYSEALLMVESEVFFEPYHRVLKVLQNTKDDLPMSRYIVNIQKDTQPPVYLTPDTKYIIKNNQQSDEITFPVLDVNNWPDTQIDLDESQLDAYKFALTREFAVIQGPPGTGKTFLGIKIASTLLKNLSLEGTPMLIICYTNHALDQFLEGILETTDNIVRLGSQSKSKVLEPYNLNAMRSKVKSKYSHLYGKKRRDLEEIFQQMVELQNEIEKCEKEILCYKNIKPYLVVNDQALHLRGNIEDAILSWLFGDIKDMKLEINFINDDDWETKFDEKSDGVLDTCFSEQWAADEIESMNNIRSVTGLVGDNVTNIPIRIQKVNERLADFKNFRALCDHDKLEDNARSIQIEDPYKMTREQRWIIYYTAVRRIKNELLRKMNEIQEQYNTYSQELEEVSTLIDCDVMKSARVVGVTTTNAARRHDLMKKLLSPIVIVEEAAEVLEAHIVASLTHQCQHLILIGDHKQLRPTAAHYKLAKEYNLEISLFERMIRNEIHAKTLTVQRRMRPNFVELIVPTIYERLDSHSSVYSYKDVVGMKDNLFFFEHDVFEDSFGMEDSWSHKNSYEAAWCAALANYLIKQGYPAADVTILATYTGQASLIQKISKQYPPLHNVKITVVDNYQGEENRIVILSLVRSNREGKIGFLAAQNRICVALSRAKEGLYIFGNMKLLRNASPIWRCINEKLLAQNAIGHAFATCCDVHKDCTKEVKHKEDFNKLICERCLTKDK